MNNSISVGHELAYTNNLIARRIARGGNNKYAMNISPIQVRIVKYLVKQNNKAILQKDMEYIFNIRRSIRRKIQKLAYFMDNFFLWTILIINNNWNNNRINKNNFKVVFIIVPPLIYL